MLQCFGTAEQVAREVGSRVCAVIYKEVAPFVAGRREQAYALEGLVALVDFVLVGVVGHFCGGAHKQLGVDHIARGGDFAALGQ